ncbi:helix-turn-helix transcriptional regulator [Arsenophonus sp. PmNCSU2021_1]|uniref:helix-turn-helix transcriptional regulator n=1 Tax=Arsenophonus sp. PmNCSU2021_1 TaxID=3118989 RepID=UPI002FF004E8
MIETFDDFLSETVPDGFGGMSERRYVWSHIHIEQARKVWLAAQRAAKVNRLQTEATSDATRFMGYEEMEKKLNKSRTTIWRMIKKGEFPKPKVTKGGLFLGWSEESYNRWVELQNN